MTITLTVDDDRLVEALPDEQQVSLLLRDALAEFVFHRGPSPSAYVERRYPASEGYDWLDRDKKVQEVRLRRAWADHLHHATVRVTP